MIAIRLEELRSWSRLVHSFCGVSLDDTKGYLLETRLEGLVRETGVRSFAELEQRVRADATG